jgi:hypothetical protein
MKQKFTQEELNFLFKKYPTNGIKYCAEQLNRTEISIQRKVSKLKLKINDISRKERQRIAGKNRDVYHKKHNINEDMFFNIKEPAVAYFLGLLWSDGYIISKGSGKENSIKIEAKKSDLIEIIDTLSTMGKWTISTRTRPGRQEQMLICTSNRILVDFLVEHGYLNKKIESADKILSKIPDNLKHYFFRGLSDGDGCFYINEKNKCYQYSIASTYEQDWSYIKSLFNLLDLKYTIVYTNKHNSKSSVIRLTNKKGIIKFGNYIYSGESFGFSRKYEKYKLISDAHESACL